MSEIEQLKAKLEQAHKREAAMREALAWALDIIDMYDLRLVQLGDPTELVNSKVHLCGKARAKAALASDADADYVRPKQHGRNHAGPDAIL